MPKKQQVDLPGHIDVLMTLKVFGYNPKDLAKSDQKKRVVVRCSNCNTLQHIIMKSAVERSNICRKCNGVVLNNNKRSANSRHFTDEELLTIRLTSGCFIGRFNGVKVTMRGYRRNGKIYAKCILINEFIHLLDRFDIQYTLGELNNLIDAHSRLLLAIEDYILNLPVHKIFSLVTYALSERFITLAAAKESCTYSMTNNKFFIKLFGLIGVQFLKETEARRAIIVKGSFFVDGQWIHIDKTNCA